MRSLSAAGVCAMVASVIAAWCWDPESEFGDPVLYHPPPADAAETIATHEQ